MAQWANSCHVSFEDLSVDPQNLKRQVQWWACNPSVKDVNTRSWGLSWSASVLVYFFVAVIKQWPKRT